MKSIIAGSSTAGSVSGWTTMVVTPPAAAARLADFSVSLGSAPGFAGLDPNVDQAGREAQTVGVDDLIRRQVRRRTMDDAADATVLDQQAAGAVVVRSGVKQTGVDDGDGGHRASPQRAEREANTAMRAATPIST
jgi:hypothetical protein